MKTPTIPRQYDFLPPLPDPVRVGFQKQFPIINPTTRRTSNLWRSVISATIVAACAALAQSSLGQLSPSIEVNETLMTAQAYDVLFMDMLDPLSSPLSYTSSADPDSGAFSYGLTAGQSINGEPVSETSNGTGDYATGTEAWDSSIQIGGQAIEGQFSGQWVSDPFNVNGTFSLTAVTRWLVTGTTTITTSNAAGPVAAFDDGTVTLQMQVLVGNQWANTDDPAVTANLASVLLTNGTWHMGTWVTNPSIRIDGASGKWTGTILPVPETPSTLTLLAIGASGLLAYGWRRRTARFRTPQSAIW